MVNISMKQYTRIGEKTVAMVNSTGKSEHLKMYEIRTLPHIIHKNKLKMA